MTDTTEFDVLLDNMLHKINDGACNYVLSFGVFPHSNPLANIDQVISDAFEGKARVYNSELVSRERLISDMTDALQYVDHQPSGYMNTDQHKKDLSYARKLLHDLLWCTRKVVKFEFSRSFHPYHPIFFEYAYAAWFEDCVIVFVTSASD